MYHIQQDTISLHYSKAKKILVMNPKGGVGKSTCVAALVSNLSHLGYNIEVIDFNRQHLCYDWAKEVLPGNSQLYNPSLRSLSNIATTLRVKRDTDFVVIDSPSNFTKGEMTRYTYFVDAILLPMSPSPLDLHTSLPFIKEIIDSGVLSTRKIALAFILNRCMENDSRVERTFQLLQNFRQYPTLAKISEDIHYQDAFFYKRAISVSVDPHSWVQVIGWIQEL